MAPPRLSPRRKANWNRIEQRQDRAGDAPDAHSLLFLSAGAMTNKVPRRLPVGAEVRDDGVHFRVWAPKRRQVAVVFDDGSVHPLLAEEEGYYSGLVARAKAGTKYAFRLDDDPRAYPDPASRFQPEGVHGFSEVIDPASYRWNDDAWRGLAAKGQVIYELHLGTFSRAGTFAGAIERLPELAEVGITVLEIMPVADFPGEFGWGYDGVDLFAPCRLYGRPDDFRRLVDAAHQLGMGVILDVVYNHLGPRGNYLGAFASEYFSERYKTEWGEPLNFDGQRSAAVREFYAANAAYWIGEFHLDGLRLDAIQAIFDESPEHILAVIGQRVRQAAAGRSTLIVAENELQDPRTLAPLEEGGLGLDAVWNDDFHHAARVAATGHNEFYYGDVQGTPQELISATKWGYLYQGQWNSRQQKRRGGPVWNMAAERFVTFLQNHDQVANSGQGMRLHQLTSPGRHRALTALLLLAPGTPLLFQGQEFAASAPFLYFADHEVDVASLVREGRQEFLRQFRSLSGEPSPTGLHDPSDRGTFDRCKLDWSERQRHVATLDLHRDLLALRRNDPVFAAQDSQRLHGAVVSAEALVLRYFGDRGQDRLLLFNLGRDLYWQPASEPLLGAPAGSDWRIVWSSEDPRYGGSGIAPLDTRQWWLAGHAAVVLGPTHQLD
jgi:maltooligosyltrehalose trehalohydrolase